MLLPRRIFIIDQRPELAEELGRLLSPDVLQMTQVSDGVQAIAAAQLWEPDVIFVGSPSGEMSALSVCELLSIQTQTAPIPIMVMSSDSDPQDALRALDHGACDYLAWPIDASHLRARLRVALRFRIMLELESRRAFQDSLTGLWNRAYLKQRLNAEIAAAERHNWPLSALLMDLDHFKKLNDSHGHGIGDHALQRFAGILGSLCRREDVAVRYGGEEFVVLCPGVDAAGAAVLAERIRTRLEHSPLELDEAKVFVTCSIGVATWRRGVELIADADRAMYLAKTTGRNRVCIAPATDARLIA